MDGSQAAMIAMTHSLWLRAERSASAAESRPQHAAAQRVGSSTQPRSAQRSSASHLSAARLTARMLIRSLTLWLYGCSFI